MAKGFSGEKILSWPESFGSLETSRRSRQRHAGAGVPAGCLEPTSRAVRIKPEDVEEKTWLIEEVFCELQARALDGVR